MVLWMIRGDLGCGGECSGNFIAGASVQRACSAQKSSGRLAPNQIYRRFLCSGSLQSLGLGMKLV